MTDHELACEDTIELVCSGCKEYPCDHIVSDEHFHCLAFFSAYLKHEDADQELALALSKFGSVLIVEDDKTTLLTKEASK